jgi:hypothetical protein
MKVDFISFPTSPESPQSDSVCNRGDRRKLEVCCNPNLAYASPFPFRSSPWFLMKTRVHVSPRSKQDGQELKKELTWWLTFRARARVIGPAVVGVDGVDVWSVLMSSSFSCLFLLLFLSFFCRGLNVLFGTMTTQTIRLLHTASSKSDLTTLVNTADAKISKMIVECSDRILLQGQIRWKEDNFKFLDCI